MKAALFAVKKTTFESTVAADLFCVDLVLYQLRHHGIAFRHPGQRCVDILHVFGLEHILHSYRDTKYNNVMYT